MDAATEKRTSWTAPTMMTPTRTKKRKRLVALKPTNDRPGNRMVSTSSLHEEGHGTTTGANGNIAQCSYKDDCDLLDLSAYTRISMVGRKGGDGISPSPSDDALFPPVVVAEAMVTMEDLVEYTLATEPRCVPAVVAEFRSITVGGAISGAALESSSLSRGLFVDAVAWMKVRLGNGDVVTTQRGEPLWCSMSGTYGSVGTVLEAAIECVTVKGSSPPAVKVSYYRFPTIQDGIEALVDMSKPTSSSQNEEPNGDGCFVDGIQMPNEFGGALAGSVVVMHGRVVAAGDGETGGSSGCDFGWKSPSPGGPFYYEHVVDIMEEDLRGKRRSSWRQRSSSVDAPFFEELIEIRDYLFRYDAGAFWMARPMAFRWRDVLSYLPFTIGMFFLSHRWVRYLTGKLFTTRNLYRMLHAVPQSVVADKMIVQDLYVPPENASEAVLWIRSNVSTLSTPIWLCPVRSNSNQLFTPNYIHGGRQNGLNNNKVLINCAVYGRVSDGNGRAYTRQLEERCYNQWKGRKMLYAQNYYSRERFWTIYNSKHYEQQRREHNADVAFPDLYDKTCVPVPERGNSWKEMIASWFL